LLTLQPGISESQTREMQTENIQLVLPRNLHEFFMPTQQAWLMDVSGFIRLVKQRQQHDCHHNLCEAGSMSSSMNSAP